MDTSEEDSDRIPDGTEDQSGRAPGGEGPSSSDFLGHLQRGAPAEELAIEVLRARLKEEESPLLALYDLGVLSEQLRAGSTPGGRSGRGDSGREARAEKAREAARLLAKRLAPDSSSSESDSSEQGTPTSGTPTCTASERKQTETDRDEPIPEDEGPEPKGTSPGVPSEPGASSEDSSPEGISTGETSKEDPSNGTPGYFYAEIEKAGYEGTTAVQAEGPGEAYHRIARYFVRESGATVSPEDVEAHVRLFRFTGEDFEEKRKEFQLSVRQGEGTGREEPQQEGGADQGSSGKEGASEWDPATDPAFTQIDASAAAGQMLARSDR